MKPTLLVYGNCQADAASVILSADPVVNEAYEILCLRSFDDPVAGRGSLQPQEVARCAVLFEQYDPKPFPHRDLLPKSAVHVRFPAVDFNLLWPFNAVNPYNDVGSPDYPWGRFPYGDRIIIDVPGQKLAVDLSDAELERRRQEWRAPPRRVQRGWLARYSKQVTSANTGAVLRCE